MFNVEWVLKYTLLGFNILSILTQRWANDSYNIDSTHKLTVYVL